MKKVMLVLVLVCCFALPKVEAETIYIRDGLIHNIDYAITGLNLSIYVTDNIWGEPTTVNLLDLGYLGATVTIQDTSILNILGGMVERSVRARDDSTVNMTMGLVKGDVSIGDGDADYWGTTTHFTMSGGIIKGYLQVYGTSELSGDAIIEDRLFTENGGKTTLYGGQVGGYWNIESRAIAAIVGTDFLLDGHVVSGSFTNSHTQNVWVSLVGIYLDGSPIDLTLWMDPGAKINFISEPVIHCSAYPVMDFNKDCKVNFADFAIFAQSWLDCNLVPESSCWE